MYNISPKLTLRDQQPKNCVLCFALTLNSAKLSLYVATLIVFIKSKLVAYGFVWYHGDRNKIAYTDICIKVGYTCAPHPQTPPNTSMPHPPKHPFPRPVHPIHPTNKNIVPMEVFVLHCSFWCQNTRNKMHYVDIPI